MSTTLSVALQKVASEISRLSSRSTNARAHRRTCLVRNQIALSARTSLRTLCTNAATALKVLSLRTSVFTSCVTAAVTTTNLLTTTNVLVSLKFRSNRSLLTILLVQHLDDHPPLCLIKTTQTCNLSFCTYFLSSSLFH